MADNFLKVLKLVNCLCCQLLFPFVQLVKKQVLTFLFWVDIVVLVFSITTLFCEPLFAHAVQSGVELCPIVIFLHHVLVKK